MEKERKDEGGVREGRCQAEFQLQDDSQGEIQAVLRGPFTKVILLSPPQQSKLGCAQGSALPPWKHSHTPASSPASLH